VYDYVAEKQVGTPIRYALKKSGMRFERTVRSMRFSAMHYWLTVGAFVVFGVISMGSSVVVALLQPRTPTARAFLSQGIFGGLGASSHSPQRRSTTGGGTTT
jgi:hypothetical protein